MRRLDQKLDRIVAGSGLREDFILADAKDPDAGGGRRAPGPERNRNGLPSGSWRPLSAFLDEIRDIVLDERIDVMLVSISTLERLEPDMFANSPVTPAIRANDATDVWDVRAGRYKSQPSRPFRSASLAQARELGCDLGLYSITFNNEADADTRSLEAFSQFRNDAASTGLRYFLEVFNPNVDCGLSEEEIGPYVVDCVLRTLAGLTARERPLFLKVPYNGARSMEELCSYDPSVIVGVLGGAAGTHHDTFRLLADAQQCGAWVALFGRKIKLAESPRDMVRFLRRVADGELDPTQAVHLYREALKKQEIEPFRSLPEDLRITEPSLIERV